jgi:hypothetical protein
VGLQAVKGDITYTKKDFLKAINNARDSLNN